MAYARSQYAAKHFGPPRRTAFLAAIAPAPPDSLGRLLRAAATRAGAAQRRALMTLLGREEPPFGPAAAAARRAALGCSRLAAAAGSGARRTSVCQSSSISSAQIRCEWSFAGLVPVEQPSTASGRNRSRQNEAGSSSTSRVYSRRSPAQPLRQRHREPLLGPVEDRVRQPGPQGVAQDPLLLHAAQLHRRRDRGGELHHLGVEEGRARLQRVGHRRDVDLGQQVAG